MKALIFGVLAMLLTSTLPAADNGIVAKPSKYSVTETLDRLEAVLKAKGVKVFARIDHSGEAEKSGLKLRPTQLLIFGNPKMGTGIMDAAPSAAIDLPLKALAWQDESGKVWLDYNSAEYLRQRHSLSDESGKKIAAAGTLIDQSLE
jgi:uncharacterized protein (DUF302 family)